MASSNEGEIAMLRIVLTGAESSGKSTLTSFLANRLDLPYAHEYAREYLEKNGAYYDYEIVQHIAREHKIYQNRLVPKEALIGFFDTDLLNFQIWCEVAYGKCEAWLHEEICKEINHVYLLCRPDLPWVPDPLREYPDGRDFLFQKHLEAIQATRRDYEIIEGIGTVRESNALQAVKKIMIRAGLAHS